MCRSRWFLCLGLWFTAAASAQPLGVPTDDILGTLGGLPPNGLTGSAANDQFGRSVAAAGDVNGDGYADLIVGAPFSDITALNAGRATIYLGGPAMSNHPFVSLSGVAGSDYFGFSVAGAGDVNGDGFDDVIVGAYGNDARGSAAGQAYIYFGGAAMDVVPDVTLTGTVVSGFFGYSVSGAGDVNGDGFGDVIVGAPGHDAGGADRGRAFIYLGGASMDAVSDVNMNGGTAAGDQFGTSVSSAGDVNGDGYDDVIVGSPYYSAPGADVGRATLYFGGAAMNTGIDVTMIGEATGDQFGYAVASAGDVNGDGYADVLVGAPMNDQGALNAGKVSVYFGGPSVDDGADVTLVGSWAGGRCGFSVAGVGDADGDGFDDLVVGAPFHSSGGANAGRAFLFRGGEAVHTLAAATLLGGAGEQAGSSVAGAGDLNGDGRADIASSAPSFNGARGRVGVYSVGLTGIDRPDEIFGGESGGDLFGVSVAGAGDVNGDGFDDLIVGATSNAAGGNAAGRAYIYFGGERADAIPDVTLTGAASGDVFGNSVSGAGDVNGDGFDDVIVGAKWNDAGGANAGRAYVFFGGVAMDTVPDVTMTGSAAEDYFGYAVAGAGDLNGDGYADVVVGAPYNDDYDTNAGRANVYFGGNPMNAVADFSRLGAGGDLFGFSVAGAGDVNADGYDDLMIGAPSEDSGGADAGAVHVYYGGPTLGGPVVLRGGRVSAWLGRVVASAGDVNGDGFDDVLVASHDGVDLYHGGPTFDETPDVTLAGSATADGFGDSMAGAGDVNRDGFDDVLVGAQSTDQAGINVGRATLYFGGVAMDGHEDVVMNGEASQGYFGVSVASAGDVDGDGLADVLIGAYLASSSGRAYLFRSTYPPASPRIAAVRDVPDDQGGVVTVEWTRSAYDGAGDARVTEYLVERSRGGGIPAWEPVATIPATERHRYSAVVPTYGVPAEGTSTPVRIQVSARTAHASQYWRSGIATGASIDNLPPPAPSAVAATAEGDATRLNWVAPGAPDLAGYVVHRSPTSGFIPDSTTRVATVDGLTWTDSRPPDGAFYRVAARDVNGNEGAPSEEASAHAVDAEAGAPTVFALAAPSPNPAGRAAEIRYALPVASRVALGVYDVLGREVAGLVSAERAAGHHRVTLQTSRLAAGAYVVRLEAGTFVATRPLTVAR